MTDSFKVSESNSVPWTAKDRADAQARALGPDLADLLRRLVDGAVVRGRCVWCAHQDDPDDGQHTDTCLVGRARALLSSLDQEKPQDA